jgi:dTDP-4-dehydrorhamnose reductase
MYAPNHLILRTCGLYGIKGSRGKGGNFVETMLKLAAAGKPLRIVGDQTCTPSFTVDVADAARRLLATDARGIVHVTNAGSCTWFEFASTIFENAGLNVPVERITSVEFAAPARRPSFSALALDKYQSLTHHELPAWPQALDRYLALRG